MKLVLPTCEKCKRTVPADKAIRLTWRHKGISVDLCPKCYLKIYQQGLKDIRIKKELIAKMGEDVQGAKEVDIKRYLEKWAMNLKSRIE